MTAPRTFFLDRDGTLNISPAPGRYVRSPDELTLLPGVAAAIRTLNRTGRRVVVVTNQRGVARGLMSLDDLAAVHERLTESLRAQGAFLDAVYACTHHEFACRCRKPQPGLLQRAMADFPDIAPGDAVMIGDTESDVGAGRAAGTRTVLLAEPGRASAADLVAADLRAAVDVLLGDVSPGGTPSRGLPPGQVRSGDVLPTSRDVLPKGERR
ncbi:D-glycero-alpha-D-manno-heptose-1,7-bisphosphate 7-phosphatase [Embleya sp. AB8]|uniref:D-glycero-alpha-D-manno-heptose-1,7-bisphosphate 7-phosphatase n=1 Tax=Embleya sp. AB8 TaxID=3156304 RepID=UPI003C79399E